MLEDIMPRTSLAESKKTKRMKRKSSTKKKKKKKDGLSSVGKSIPRKPTLSPLVARRGSRKAKFEKVAKDIVGTREGERRASSRQGRMSRKHSSALDRLTKTPKRSFHMGNLDVEMLAPLVDLAYWSTFLEVRRDAAAAFATLALNEANLEVLSHSGALGALLALIGVNNGKGKNDVHVHRDAAAALACLAKLDDIKHRLLKAPDGLNSIYYLCKSPSFEVKRAAVNILENLCKLDEVKEEVVSTGVFGTCWRLRSQRMT